MIDRREDPEDKAQWREPANREPPEFDAHEYVADSLRILMSTLWNNGFDVAESKMVIAEVLENES